MFNQDDVQAQGHRQHREQRTAQLGSLQHHVVKVFQLHFVVYKGFDDYGVNQRHRSGFCGREITAVNAAQQDDRHHDGQNAVLAGQLEFFQAELLARHIAVVPKRVNGENDQQQDSGAHARQEHVSHRSFSNQAVNDHRDRRRNDDAQGAARHDGAQRELVVVATSPHGRVHHGANGQHGDDGRAGDRGKNAATQDGRNRQPARQGAGEGRHDVDQAFGGGALRHYIAAQYEERNRQDELFVQPHPHVFNDVVVLAFAPGKLHKSANGQQNDNERLAQPQQGYNERNQQDGGAHSWNSGGRGRNAGHMAYKK